MDFKKALGLLELKEGFTEDDLKKQFRKLAAKYHPDVNKDPKAEKKSKEISEAYTFLKDPKNWNVGIKNNPSPGYQTIKVNFGKNSVRTFRVQDLFKMKTYHVPAKTVKIPLKDAILGCTVKTTVNWTEPCTDCQRGEAFCKTCKGLKQASKNGNWNLTLAPGIQNNATISLDKELNGIHYKFSFVVLVEEDPKFSRQGNDLYIKKNVSLLEALQGAEIEVETFKEKVKIKIEPKTKNNDLVIVNTVNLPNSGRYKVILLVDYPDNINDLINFLKKENK